MASTSSSSKPLVANHLGPFIDVIAWVSVAAMFVAINFGSVFPFARALCVFLGLWFSFQNHTSGSDDDSNLGVQHPLKFDILVPPHLRLRSKPGPVENVKPFPAAIEGVLTKGSLVPIPPHLRSHSKPASGKNVKLVQKTPTKVTEKKQAIPNLRQKCKNPRSGSQYISPNRHNTGQTRRSPPPVAAGWANAQAMIQQNDSILQAESIARAKEMNNKLVIIETYKGKVTKYEL